MMANVREPMETTLTPDNAVLRIESADEELFAVQSRKERSQDCGGGN